MIISEIIERECCQDKDLEWFGDKPQKYRPIVGYKMKCIHCGQIWKWDRRMDAAGSMENLLKKDKQ